MFKWTKEILLTLAKKCNPKQAFLLLGMIIFFTGGYFVLDRILDHSEMAIAMNDKIEIEKPENTTPEYVLYKDRTLHEFKADNIKKTGELK